MRKTVLACLLASLAACPADPGQPPEPTPEAPFDPSAYETLSSELTEADREMTLGTDGESVYAAQRLRVDTPARIVAVEAMWKVRREYTGEAHLAVWPDWGHNFFDFDRPNPLWEWTGPLDRFESDEQWTLFELEEPIDLPHPQLLYVGTWHQGGEDEPVLMVDGQNSVDPFLAEYANEDTQYPPHIAVYPDRGRDSGGFESVSFAPGGGDLMVRLYIERYGVVDQTWFTEQQATDEDPRSGLPGVGSVAWGDCDDDGLLDVYNGNLWVNQGDGTFVSTTAEAGIDLAGGAGMWGDYDNDGLLDLFVARNDDQLYRGLGGCAFENVTVASGIDDTQPFDTGEGAVDQNVPTPSAAWVDVDGDGWLDLYQANFLNFGTGDSSVDLLWHNQGDGSFVDVTVDVGLSQGGGRAGRGVHPADWDNDGDMDIYVSNYRLHQNFAWENDGGSFSGIQNGSLLGGYRNNGAGTVSYYGHTIGSVWGDVDNDGDLDLFAANLAHPRFFSFSDKSMFLQNTLMETGTVDWIDVREDAGMLYQETDSSPILFELDNDGDLDLFYTAIYPARPSYLYRNDGDWTYAMVSYEAGTWVWNGWGVAAADYDNDGDMDIYGGKLLRNDSAADGGWISVQAFGSGDGATNVSGIGARIYVTTDAGEQMREVTSGVGVGNQMPLRQHVGLGAAASADVRVEFPVSGTVIEVGDVASGTRLEVHEDGTTNQ
mgnify:CR=1 FL=1